MEHGDNEIFGGSTILMQIYANGYGVPRNSDLATSFACNVDAAPLEIELRVSALQDSKGKADKFDICDYVSSGLLGGFCLDRESQIAAVGRDAKLMAIVAGLPPAGRAEWPVVQKAFGVYIEASAGGETDESGTMRGADVVDAKDGLRDQQLKDLERMRRNQWPVATAEEARDADAKLNASYRKALSWAAGSENHTTIEANAIRATQRAWLAYRDAYLRFAAVAAPTVSRDAVLTRLTRLRLADLDALTSD